MRDTNTGTPITLSTIPVAWVRVLDSPKVRKKPSGFGLKAIFLAREIWKTLMQVGLPSANVSRSVAPKERKKRRRRVDPHHPGCDAVC